MSKRVIVGIAIGALALAGCGGGAVDKLAAPSNPSSSATVQQPDPSTPKAGKGLNCPSAKRVADAVGYYGLQFASDALYDASSNGQELARELAPGSGVYTCTYFDRPEGGYSYRVSFTFALGEMTTKDEQRHGTWAFFLDGVVADRPELGTGAFEITTTKYGGLDQLSAGFFYPGDGGYYGMGVNADASMGLSIDQLKSQNEAVFSKLFRGMTISK